MPPTNGYLVVLTADRTLMGDYPTLLDGMMGTIQTTAGAPELVMRRFLSPRIPHRDGRALKAPLGLRRIEALLHADGLSENQVAIVPPEELAGAIGPATRVVGVSSGDPLGQGMSNTTMIALCKGSLYTARWYAELMSEIRWLRESNPGFRVLAGGPGAWQLANQPKLAAELGIDTIFTGYAERDGAKLFRRLIDGEAVEPVVQGARAELEDIPPILGATSMGVVEISRGCGRGCGFCTLAHEPMFHLPVEHVVADADTNLRAGVQSLALISEDFLRYGSTTTEVEPEALLTLLRSVRILPELRMIQVDHVNVSSVMQYTPGQLREVREAMTAGARHEQPWVNMGVESASGELMMKAGLGGKVHPFSADQWPLLCERAVLRLIEAGFVPMVSLVMGLPGETVEHVEQTIELIRRFFGRRLVVFPIFYAPLDPAEHAFGLEDMTPQHWRLFRMSYDLNFQWIPPMFWDNHRAAGAPMWRRLFIQSAGQVQKLQWKLKFALATGKLHA